MVKTSVLNGMRFSCLDVRTWTTLLMGCFFFLYTDALNAINNAEKAGKRQVLIRPSSKVIVKFLSVMQRHGRSSC